MENGEVEKIAEKMVEAKGLLEEIGNTSFEGVNANIRKAVISIQQALYDLGKEEERGG